MTDGSDRIARELAIAMYKAERVEDVVREEKTSIRESMARTQDQIHRVLEAQDLRGKAVRVSVACNDERCDVHVWKERTHVPGKCTTGRVESLDTIPVRAETITSIAEQVAEKHRAQVERAQANLARKQAAERRKAEAMRRKEELESRRAVKRKREARAKVRETVEKSAREYVASKLR